MGASTVIGRTLALLGALGLLVVLAGPDLPAAVAAVRDPQGTVDARGADVFILNLVQLGFLVLCAWCALCVALLAACSLRPSAALRWTTDRLTPRRSQRVLAAALGIGALTLAGCGTSSGSSAAASSTPPAYAASSDAFDWALSPALPDAPTTADATPADQGPAKPDATGPAPAGSVAHAGTLVVTPGDCLWSLATAHLGPGASTADVAYFVDALYRGNQHLIGDDPDVLPVGAVLALPAW